MKRSSLEDLEGSLRLSEKPTPRPQTWSPVSLRGGAIILSALLLLCLSGSRSRAIITAMVPQTGMAGWSGNSGSTSAVDWQPCEQDPAYLCGFLTVPTDYFDPSAGNTTLALSKYEATCPKSKRLGSIMTNFGGPGVPGRTALLSIGPRLSKHLGGRHDIIAYDQRGLGETRPRVNCFGTDVAYDQFKANTVLESTFSIPKDPFSPEGRAVLVQQQKDALALEEAQAGVCRDVMGDSLRFMSTSSGVRDMEEISRVLEGEDAKINFWGGSYGTIFGSYLVNMLPHKVGKVLIDGVVPNAYWVNTHYENQKMLRLLLTDSEITLDWFFKDCFNAGPARCHLTESSDDGPKDIKDRFDAFLERLQQSPMPVSNSVRPGLLKSGAVRQITFNFLQVPDLWAGLAQLLALAMKGNAGPLLRLSSRPLDGRAQQADLGRLAISCGDALPYPKGQPFPTAEEMVEDILGTMKNVSERFGGTVHLMEQHGGCQFWPSTGTAPEIYSGPWNTTLETPMLIVSNTHDPVTPLAAGRIVKDDFGDSARLLIQDAAGHSYLSPPNECASKIVRRYFVEGILPDADETFCARDGENYFPAAESGLVERGVAEVVELLTRAGRLLL